MSAKTPDGRASGRRNCTSEGRCQPKLPRRFMELSGLLPSGLVVLLLFANGLSHSTAADTQPGSSQVCSEPNDDQGKDHEQSSRAQLNEQYIQLEGQRVTDAQIQKLSTALVKGLNACGTDLSDEMLYRLESMERLHSLDLSATPLTDEGIRKLRKLTLLTSLNLSGVGVTDEALRALAQMSLLRTLDLSYTQISGQGLQYLPLDNALEKLSIRRSGAARMELVWLTRCKKLTHLALSGCRIGSNECEHIAKLKELEELTLDYTDIDDKALAQLSALSKLRRLNLRSTAVSDIGLDACSEMKELEYLDLSQTDITNSGLSRLAKLSHLRALILNGTSVSHGALDFLQSNLELRSLYLVDTDVGFEDWTVLNPNIQQLYLSRTKVTDGDMAAIVQCFPSLLSLSLSHTTISNRAFDDIAHLRSLQALWADHTGITDHAASEASKCKSLRLVNMRRTGISGQGFLSLLTIPALRRLDVGWNGIRGYELTKMPTGVTALEEVNLENCPVVGPKLAELSNALGGAAIVTGHGGVDDIWNIGADAVVIQGKVISTEMIDDQVIGTIRVNRSFKGDATDVGRTFTVASYSSRLPRKVVPATHLGFLTNGEVGLWRLKPIGSKRWLISMPDGYPIRLMNGKEGRTSFFEHRTELQHQSSATNN